ncbi:MAG: beta-galactosidase, partial [Kiritimatiellae bacterium]|nr:beta-galactosidase [Kiritimatiellia bacterium]
MNHMISRRRFLGCAGGISLFYASSMISRAMGAERDNSAKNLSENPSLVTEKMGSKTTPLYWSWWGWEPLDHYRRGGGTAGAVDINSASALQWFDRLHSEETVKMMAGLGVNLGITHFFKGFGLKHERVEQERTAQLVKFAHKHGIRVLGYCQSRSLYYETFLAEEPKAAEWIQRDPLGQPITWGSAYYRWAPCVLSTEFRQYMKKAIRVGLEEIGLDGLHFDNDYADACYCSRCQQAFRVWLTENYPNPREFFGLASFEQVRLPPSASSAGRIHDQLIRAWVRFRCESLGDYHRDITSYARSLRSDVILLGNPAYPRSVDAPYKRSVWAPLLGRHLTLMFAENGNFPGMVDGTLMSQIRAYKEGAAVGYRVVSTTWQRGSETGLGLPKKAEQVGLQVCEAAAFGSIPGTNWALRPTGDGDRMQVDRPELREALGRYLKFVRANEKLMTGARPVQEIAILHSFASLTYDAQQAWPMLLGTEEVLIRGGFSWEVVFGDDLSRLDGFSTLVLAGHSNLSKLECETIRAFAKGGGGLVLIGENGKYDEYGRERAKNILDNLSGERIVHVESRFARSAIDASYTVRVPLSKEWKQVAAAIQRAAGDRLSARLMNGDTVAISTYEISGKRLVVHLVNYAAPDTRRGMRLILGRHWDTARTVRMLLPEE